MRVLKISWKAPLGGKKTREIADCISEGMVVALPTDTVYGLCAKIDKDAVEKIFRIKSRPENKPIPIFVNSLEMAASFSKIDAKRKALLKKIWPAPVSVILPKKDRVPSYLTANTNTVMLRWANNEFINQIIKMVGGPITSTSANVSGKGAIKDGRKLIASFAKRKEQPDIIVDAGVISKSNEPSTIIDFTTGNPTPVREGVYKWSDLRKKMGIEN
jgi:L-threonylcarbamoyladenylate synthase